MEMLPDEVFDRIVQFSRTPELLVLSRVSKQLQPVAEARLYEIMRLYDQNKTFHGCLALSRRDYVRASYVRQFWVYQDPRLCQRGPLPEQVWQTINAILRQMKSLQSLYLFDFAFSNSHVLEGPMPFKLREAWLYFQWDSNVVTFLETQDSLHFLSVQTGPEEIEDVNHRSPAVGTISALDTLEAPLHVAFDLIAWNLKRLALVIDDDNAPLFGSFLESLTTINKTIRSFWVVAIPEFLVADTLRVLGASTLSTTLRHLGVLSLPSGDRHDIHRSLLKFSRLEALQVDVSHWHNTPVVLFVQRMVVTELRTYCHSLRQVVFWHGTNQTFWRYDKEQWTHQVVPGTRYVARDHLWREF